MSSLKRFDGYLSVDHRASPGLNEELARKTGVPERHVREGGLLELSTMTCWHCGTVVVPNPLRTRERGYCVKCDRYICDHCKLASLEATYVHRSFQEIVDLVQSGRFTLSGSPSAPVLVPVSKGDEDVKLVIPSS